MARARLSPSLRRILPVGIVDVLEDQAGCLGERVPQHIEQLHNIGPFAHLARLELHKPKLAGQTGTAERLASPTLQLPRFPSDEPN